MLLGGMEHWHARHLIQVAGEKFSFFLEKSFTFYFEKSDSFLTPLLVPENQTSASCLLLVSQCSTLPQPTLTVRTFISITIPCFCSSYRLWISPSPRIFSPASLQLPLPSSTSHHITPINIQTCTVSSQPRVSSP